MSDSDKPKAIVRVLDRAVELDLWRAHALADAGILRRRTQFDCAGKVGYCVEDAFFDELTDCMTEDQAL